MEAAQDPAYELLGLLGEEFASGDIDNRLVASDGEAPAQLVIPLIADERTEATLNLCFLPEPAYPPVLQYIVALDCDVVPEAVETTARFLHLVNTTLPLTGFELGENAAAVVFRYLQPVTVHPLDPAVVAWPLSMIFHAVTRYEPLVAQACAGAHFADLVSGLGRANAELFGS